MTTALDTIRYHSGIAGEEVANMVDELEAKVEKLTKERNAFQDQCIRLKNERAVEKGQLAALAEQNEKMREALEVVHAQLVDGKIFTQQVHRRPYWRYSVSEALSLPDLATPALNRIKAEAYREAAEIVGPEDSYQDDWFKAKADSCAKLRAKADELDQSK